MENRTYLHLTPETCKNCYKCIRHCPVKAIRFANHQAEIEPTSCILCGECYRVCPQRAKKIDNQIPKIKDLLSKSKVIVSLAPSYLANYPDTSFSQLKLALQKLGFFDVFETADAAKHVANSYHFQMMEQPNRTLISTSCPGVNSLIRKYYPSLLPLLSKIPSPMNVHARFIKENHPDTAVVFIGPCIAKLQEADEFGLVDYAITFSQLSDWLKEEDIILPSSDFDNDLRMKSSVFAVSGGILETLPSLPKPYLTLKYDGIESVISILEDLLKQPLEGVFLELSTCLGSCINGPGMTTPPNQLLINSSSIRRKILTTLTQETSNYSIVPQQYSNQSTKKTKPSERIIQEILKKMGKRAPTDLLNCGSCGYSTCKEKAIALYEGKADLTMCLPFLKEKAESFADSIVTNSPNAIIVLNNKLEIQLMNQAAKDLFHLKKMDDFVHRSIEALISPDTYQEVFRLKKGKDTSLTYFPEYDKYIEQTILYDRQYEICTLLLKDQTNLLQSKKQKKAIQQETIDIANNVIKKQMRTVQEIASLLGETTAETKVALTKLKDLLNDE